MIDMILLQNMPELLTIHKENKRIAALLKACSIISIENVIDSSDIIQKQALKILKFACELFKKCDSDSKLNTIICKLLNNFSQFDSINIKFSTKPEKLYCQYFTDIKSDLISKKITITQLKRLSIILGYLPKNTVLKTAEILYTILLNSLIESDQENLLMLSKNLFCLNTSIISYYLNTNDLSTDKFIEIRNETLKVLVGHMKGTNNSLEIRANMFCTICNFMCLISNDSIKINKPNLYFEPDLELLEELKEFYNLIINLENASKTINLSEIHYEMHKSLTFLILSNQKIFNSELAILQIISAFLNDSNESQEFELLLKSQAKILFEKCNSKLYFQFTKKCILACFNADPLLKTDSEKCQNLLIKITDLVKFFKNGCLKNTNNTTENLKNFIISNTDLENYQGFVIDFLKEILKKSENFPLLEIIHEFIDKNVYTKEKLARLYQLFDAVAQHVLKVDPNISSENRQYLEKFKSRIFAKCTSKCGNKINSQKISAESRIKENQADDKKIERKKKSRNIEENEQKNVSQKIEA